MLNGVCKNEFLSARAILGIMIFMTCFYSYMLRVNMSINIIAMVEPQSSEGNQTTTQCETSHNTVNVSSSKKLSSLPDYGARYDWNQKIQGLILGSYFWGYIITSIPGGYLAEVFSPTKTVIISSLVSAIVTIFTPLAASWHYSAVIFLRFVLGLMGGVVYPALHCLLSRWIPPNEKGKYSSSLFGGTLGTVITWPLTGSTTQSFGWAWSFFIQGGLTLIYCCFMFMLVADSPDTHPRISEEEKIYISKSLGDIGKSKKIAPYWKMFTSIPFWALTILHYGNLWGLYFLLTAGPKFMSEILGFNLRESGFLAALPYLARMLASFVFGFIGDSITKGKCMGVTMTRKIFTLFSHILPGLLLFLLNLVGCNISLSIALVTLSLGFNGASAITNIVNNQDLAPNFAGTIYGVINCIGGTTGFFTPMITGYITSEHNGIEEWHIIFCIGGSVYIGAGIVFILFGSGERQSWNEIVKDNEVKAGVENLAFDAPEVTVKTLSETENTKI